ncbi:AraC family transcriptional regulator [Halioglobus japonicus]|uniref:AraC family transcriptional regulator n=1 Tax=Halioglobus japonicus TaxID=930805 RepID=A0AAP8MHI9_9GAMM|nr:AraC family transcriptional regulator [Halioglobus japonicus]PLW87928.1 AraC family transcriptional regulator [Halioglobus japonicus]GHD20131.1 AraC family transcriptional regulator [Halioglobus japonicus]
MEQDSTLQHSVLGSMVLPLAQAMRRIGMSPLEVMERVGLDSAKLANPDWRIPQREFNALLAACVEESEDEAFGLVAAEQLQAQVLHGLGLAWLASDSILDGLKRLVRFGKLLTTASNMKLSEDGDYIRLEFGPIPLSDNYHPAVRDFGVGIVARMCHLSLGDFIPPASVQLERPRPANPERWESLLSTHVEFDAPHTSVAWYKSDILEPLVTGDPALARVNDEQAQAYLDGFLAHSISRDVVDKIVQHLPDGPPSQQQIADAMHVSNRTLQRKLKEEGTSFMDLLQDTRLQLAQKYLSTPNRSVVETAYLLGFSEPSTFSRAFKRWTGTAPADFRASVQPRA